MKAPNEDNTKVLSCLVFVLCLYIGLDVGYEGEEFCGGGGGVGVFLKNPVLIIIMWLFLFI